MELPWFLTCLLISDPWLNGSRSLRRTDSPEDRANRTSTLNSSALTHLLLFYLPKYVPWPILKLMDRMSSAEKHEKCRGTQICQQVKQSFTHGLLLATALEPINRFTGNWVASGLREGRRQKGRHGNCMSTLFWFLLPPSVHPLPINLFYCSKFPAQEKIWWKKNWLFKGALDNLLLIKISCFFISYFSSSDS